VPVTAAAFLSDLTMGPMKLWRMNKMTNAEAQAERIVKALHAAEFLAADLKEAHAKADNVAEEMLMMDLLGDAHKIWDRLKRLAGAGT
jgi:hypothetical protein